MALTETLKNKYPEISDWHIKKIEHTEKERNNQNTEKTRFEAISPDKKTHRIFIHTTHTDYRGTKEFWQEESTK